MHGLWQVAVEFLMKGFMHIPVVNEVTSRCSDMFIPDRMLGYFLTSMQIPEF